MKIKEMMTVEVATLDPDASLEEAAALMGASGAGAIPIVENGRAVGVLTDRDIVVRALAKGLSPEETAVGDIMTYELVSCSEEDDAGEAERLMTRHQVRRVLVLDEAGAIKGLVAREDRAARVSAAAQVLEEVSRPLVPAGD